MMKVREHIKDLLKIHFREIFALNYEGHFMSHYVIHQTALRLASGAYFTTACINLYFLYKKVPSPTYT